MVVSDAIVFVVSVLVQTTRSGSEAEHFFL